MEPIEICSIKDVAYFNEGKLLKVTFHYEDLWIGDYLIKAHDSIVYFSQVEEDFYVELVNSKERNEKNGENNEG